jgi:hypothetical protein
MSALRDGGDVLTEVVLQSTALLQSLVEQPGGRGAEFRPGSGTPERVGV